MPSVLESVIGVDRYQSLLEGNPVEMSPEETTRFTLAVDRAKDDHIRALESEVQAWRERFPQHEFRPQGDCISLKFVHR